MQQIAPLPQLRLQVCFDDGRVIIYDVTEDVRDIPSYAPLSDLSGLFEQARLDASRTCVYWNDEIDLPSDAIYDNGTELAPATNHVAPA